MGTIGGSSRLPAPPRRWLPPSLARINEVSRCLPETAGKRHEAYDKVRKAAYFKICASPSSPSMRGPVASQLESNQRDGEPLERTICHLGLPQYPINTTYRICCGVEKIGKPGLVQAKPQTLQRMCPIQNYSMW